VSQRNSFQAFASKIGANGDPKLNAAADFTARLLDSPIGPSIARIILFGSVASSQAGPQSDVDVMVFSAAPLESRSEHAAQAAWEASVAWGEQVAQVTFCLGDLLQPRSYLLYDTINRGKEIFSMEEAEIRRMEAG
jgi:predicted nucleotidyltransferase